MSKKRQRKPIQSVDDATDKHGFQHFINIHVEDLRIRNYSELTIDNRSKYVRHCGSSLPPPPRHRVQSEA